MFGYIFKTLREEKGLSQLEMANILCVTQSTISSWEKARTQPSIEQLIIIAEYFNCSVDVLVGKDEVTRIYSGLKTIPNELIEQINSLSPLEQKKLTKLIKTYKSL